MATTRLLPSPSAHHNQTFHDKVFVALENVDASFELKGRLTGPNNSYLSHIELTGARCWLRGQGSGYFEPESGREAFEALHIHIQHSSPSGLNQAKLLAENLVHTVHQQYYQWCESRWITHPLPSPVSMPISSCSVFAVPPPPCHIVLPASMPSTTTQLIITDHHSVTGAPTQQQVVIFKQEPPMPGLYSSSSPPPLLQETITTTTTTTYYFPNSASAPLPPPPMPPVSYPLAMLPQVILPVAPPPPNRWERPTSVNSPVLYNPPPSCPPPIRPPGAASTLVAWSADFQRPNFDASTASVVAKSRQVPVKKSSDVVAPKRLKPDEGAAKSKLNNNNKLVQADAVVVKKTSALSSLAVAYNSNDNDE